MGASLAWVLLLLALFGALAWWLRFRYGREVGPEAMVVRAVRRLDAGNTLWLVEVEGRRLLIGSGRDGVRLVKDLSTVADPP